MMCYADICKAKRTRSRAAQSDTYDRHRAAALDGTAQDRHYLDLHGLSASAARMAVVQVAFGHHIFTFLSLCKH